MTKSEVFFHINKKIFEKNLKEFGNISYDANDFIQIEYGCVYKSSSKPA